MNLVHLFKALLKDLQVDSATCTYLLRRVQSEGSYVLTKLLPAFSKHVLMCLEKGVYTPFSTSVTTRKGLPVIFRGFLKQLFFRCSVTGNWISFGKHADPVSFWIIRQACEVFYKLSLPFDESQISEFTQKFVDCDNDVLTFGEYEFSFVDAMRRNFETYYRTCVGISEGDIACAAHPGPGTFVGRDAQWYLRNYSSFEVPSAAQDYRYALRLNKHWPLPTVNDSDPDYSEVLFVPKDSRGPRVIVREPYTKLQFQMGYNTCLSEALEKDTRNRVNTFDQGINRSLALSSSLDRRYATLDLKDASDRVSYAVVKHIFTYTHLGRIIQKFRSRWCKLPDGRLHRLRKLAGMGSGFTFPTMALVIHLAICTHLTRRTGLDYSQIMRQVYVYGDDIIVPREYASDAEAALCRVGLRVNADKSFKNSYFRESCGGDYLYGNDVAPLRFRMQNAALKPHGLTIASSDLHHYALHLERFAREARTKQLFSTALFCERELQAVLARIFKAKIRLPKVSGSSPYFGVLSDRNEVFSQLQPDSTGLYQKVRVVQVSPVKENYSDMCHHRYLHARLSKVGRRNADWLDRIYPGGMTSEFGTVTVPRKVRLRIRFVPGMSLT